MIGSNYYIGGLPVQKLMLGNTHVWQKADIPAELTLLSGMTFMDLPSEQWIETSSNIWKQKITTDMEYSEPLGYLMEGAGAMFFKYVDDGFDKTPDMMLFDTPDLGGGTSVIDLWVQDGVFTWEDPQDGVQTEPAVNGTFYGLIRNEYGVVRIYKTIDGIIFNELAELAGNKSGYIYLQTWWYSFELNKLYYPQGYGLTKVI